MPVLTAFLALQAPAGDSAAARRLWWAGLDQQAELRLDSALVLLRAARAADPSFFPAQHAYLMLLWQRGEFAAARREFAGDPCLAVVTTIFATGPAVVPDPDDPVAAPLVRLDRRQPSPCSATHLSGLRSTVPPHLPDLRTREYARRTTMLAPELSEGWSRLGAALRREGQADAAETALREGAGRVGHPMLRLPLLMGIVDLRLSRGDTAGSRAMARAIGAAVARDGRPGLRLVYLQGAGHRGLEEPARSPAAWEAELLALAQRYGAWPIEAMLLSDVGRWRVDRGDPAGAVPLHARQVAIADSVGAPWHQLMAYLRRGRAYSKLGHLAEAERDLHRAISAGGLAPDPYNLGEAYHNLAHVYEAAGRLDEAARAADRYTELATPIRGMPARLMSLHDAGMIRWKAGWHAAARAAFDAMVDEVDARDQEHYWAGEYFERIGDFARARAYYRRGAPLLERPENLRGLARVYERLGYLDSAEAMARLHDRRREQWAPLELPLVPGVLARRGQVAEAVAQSRAWVDRQVAGGNLHGAAIAWLQVADYLLLSGAPDSALADATRAESLAHRLHLTDEWIRARRLQGLALLRLGRSLAGLQALREAAARSRARGTVDAILTAHVALGDALAGGGRREEAIEAYERAGRAVEVVTARLDAELDRVGYRDRHLLPFDGAVRLLITGTPDASTLERLTDWSQRRKSAVLALPAGQRPDEEAAPSVPLAQLRSRLRSREALVDFQVVDHAAAALVVTTQGAALVRLPVTGDSLRALLDRLRAPLTRVVAGSVDLAHAPFDLRVAHALYRLVWAPLLPHLRGRERLLIVPDGPLHALPFEALVTRPGAGYVDAGYLLDAHEIAYLPSARFLGRNGERTPEAVDVLAFHREAPGGDEEMRAIRAAWRRGRVTVLAGSAATEAAARQPPPGVGILHFASHAEANGHDPLASHLRLAPDRQHDGYLHLSEVLRERPSVRLVVLSACETLSGRLYRGEGLMGLARAFLAGGLGAVIATHWPVGAPSADLMGGFYSRLSAGEPPSAALRDAKRDLRQRPQTAHPFYWAGFVLVEGRPVGS